MPTKAIDDTAHTRPDTANQSDDGLTQVNPSIDEIVRRAQEALQRVSCSFDDWLDIAAAVQAGRTAAMHTAAINKPSGKRFAKAMSAWLHEHKLDGIDKGVRSRLLECLKHRVEITKWRNDPKNKEVQRFNHPNKVFEAWKKWKAKQAGFDLDDLKKPSTIAKLKESVARLEEENHRMRQEIERGGDDFWRKDAKLTELLYLIRHCGRSDAWAALEEFQEVMSAAGLGSTDIAVVVRRPAMPAAETSAAERKADYAAMEVQQ